MDCRDCNHDTSFNRNDHCGKGLKAALNVATKAAITHGKWTAKADKTEGTGTSFPIRCQGLGSGTTDVGTRYGEQKGQRSSHLYFIKTMSHDLRQSL